MHLAAVIERELRPRDRVTHARLAFDPHVVAHRPSRVGHRLKGRLALRERPVERLLGPRRERVAHRTVIGHHLGEAATVQRRGGRRSATERGLVEELRLARGGLRVGVGRLRGSVVRPMARREVEKARHLANRVGARVYRAHRVGELRDVDHLCVAVGVFEDEGSGQAVPREVHHGGRDLAPEHREEVVASAEVGEVHVVTVQRAQEPPRFLFVTERGLSVGCRDEHGHRERAFGRSETDGSGHHGLADDIETGRAHGELAGGGRDELPGECERAVGATRGALGSFRGVLGDAHAHGEPRASELGRPGRVTEHRPLFVGEEQAGEGLAQGPRVGDEHLFCDLSVGVIRVDGA